METIWLKNNHRALLLGMILPGLMGLLGVALASGLFSGAAGARVVGWVLLVPALFMMVVLTWQARQPRISFRDGRLLLYVRSGGPLRIPLEVVECFLLGSGPGYLPGRDPCQDETANVVVRLSPREEEWRRGEVKPALGAWCDSHITIRGVWCEPLNEDVLRRLNAHLGDARRATAGERRG